MPASEEADAIFALRIPRPEAAVSRLAPRVPLAPGAGLRRLWGEQEGAAELCLGGTEENCEKRSLWRGVLVLPQGLCHPQALSVQATVALMDVLLEVKCFPNRDFS